MAIVLKLPTTSWRQSSKMILFKQHERSPKNSALTLNYSIFAYCRRGCYGGTSTNFTIDHPTVTWITLGRWVNWTSDCLTNLASPKEASDMEPTSRSYYGRVARENDPLLDQYSNLDTLLQQEASCPLVGRGWSFQALSGTENAPEKDLIDCLNVFCRYCPLPFHESWREHYVRQVLQGKGL